MNNALSVKLQQFYKKHIQRQTTEGGLFYTGGRPNIGDSMVPWLIESVYGKELSYSNPREANGPHLFSVGSILQYADSNCTIWGSGFISKDSKFHALPERVCAVRGRLTAEKIVQLGGGQCDAYGDPALITPRFYTPKDVNREKKIGLVPHYVDKVNLKFSMLHSSDIIKICDVETESIQSFVDSLFECEVVVSSSLHGIILAEAYGIPAIWAKFGGKVYGRDFKFHDYYSSTGRVVEPQCFYSLTEKQVCALSLAPPSYELSAMAQSLIESFPYGF